MTHATPEKVIPAMFDTRYRGVIAGCFSEKNKLRRACGEFLKKYGTLFNHRNQEDDQIKSLEVQQWIWNFQEDFFNPNYVNLVKNYIVYID